MIYGRCIAASLLVVIISPLSLADVFQWTNAVDGDYENAGNWTNTTGINSAPPNAGDTALFNQMVMPYTVTFNANAASDVLQIDDGEVTLTSSGLHTYELTTGDADANIGGGKVTFSGAKLKIGDDFSVVNSTLTVQDGSDIIAADRISIATGVGDAVVTFDASSFDFGGLVRLGLSGLDATLNLQNGSMGTIGGNFDFVRSGTLGTGGFLNVLSGSTLTTNGRVLVGDILSGGMPNYNAFVTVDDSTFTMNGENNLRVGDSMLDNVHAELRVSNSGTFSTGTGAGNSIVQRTGLLALETGGVFNARSDLLVTQGGEFTATSEAQLNTQQLFAIQSGSTVTLDGEADLMAANIEVGIDDSNAMLSIFGDGSTAMQTGSSTLQVGSTGTSTATLSVAGGAEFTTGTGATTIGSTGRIDINGGTFTANGSLTMTGGGTSTLDRGALNTNAGLNANAGLDASDGVLDFRDGKLTVTGGAFAPNAAGINNYVIDGTAVFDTPHLELGRRCYGRY